MNIELFSNTKNLSGRIPLTRSKSIANRALIINALSAQPTEIMHLASSKDTQTLTRLLNTQPEDDVYDVGPAGTTFRFLTAYLALQPGTQTLTGSKRMLERPIGPLAEGLKKLGADIEYLGEEGFPPLKIKEWKNTANNKLEIPANISSQFISALLMIAPRLPNGLELTLAGDIVSESYIRMTLGLMEKFGVSATWTGNTISVANSEYVAPEKFEVEADWSAASYFYSLAAIAEQADIELEGLQMESLQGDAAIIAMMKVFGVETSATDTGIKLQKTGEAGGMFEKNFILCPDIAQTLAVSCAALGMQGLFSGLETLSIKETDRIAAIQNELQKFQVFFSKLPEKFSKDKGTNFYHVEGKATVDAQFVNTYHDHRMAMAFAPLALLGKIQIEDAMVVEKSYPEFWDHLKILGINHKNI